MQTATPAPTAFYGGPVWARHRDAVNATMTNSDNVLLLTPAPNSVLTCIGDVGDRPEWDVGATVFGGVLTSTEGFHLHPTDRLRLRKPKPTVLW